RKFWKEALIAMLAERLGAPPQPLPPPQSWAALDRGETEFRRVAFRAEFVPGKTPAERDREARLFTSAWALRGDVRGARNVGAAWLRPAARAANRPGAQPPCASRRHPVRARAGARRCVLDLGAKSLARGAIRRGVTRCPTMPARCQLWRPRP